MLSLLSRGAALLRPSLGKFTGTCLRPIPPLLQSAYRHAVQLRSFSKELPQGLPNRRPRRRLLDHRPDRPPLSRCLRPSRGGQHWPRCCRNRTRHGRAVLATLLRAHHTVSLRAGRKISATSTRSRPDKFSPRRTRLFHLRRLRGHRDRHQAGQTISSRKRSTRPLSSRFSPPELSRQHSRSYDRQRQRRTPCALSAVARRMGTHCPVLLLPLSFRQRISRLRSCLRK